MTKTGRFISRGMLAALAWLLVAAGPALAGDFYTSPSGSDSNSCTTSSDPCQTIQAAIDKAMAGDTVHVGQGSYPFGSNRIVIDVPGLKLIGENSPFDPSSAPGAPVLAGNASVLEYPSADVPSGTSGMIWVNNVPDVEVRNLYMELKGSCFWFFCSTHVKEGIVATGNVNGLVLADNYIKVMATASQIGISVNLSAGNDSSVPSGEPRAVGQFVTITGNAIEPSLSPVGAPKRSIAVQRSAGLISGNQVAGTTQDMWIQQPRGSAANPPAQQTLTIENNWFFGKLQLYLSSASGMSAPVEIRNNHFIFPSSFSPANVPPDIAQALGNGSEAHSLRVMGNQTQATIISGNEFKGFYGPYRALWVMSRPGTIIENNTFTPEVGQQDFTAIVVGNRSVWNGLPAPDPFDVTIRGNIFHANGASAGNKAKAILFVNDNDANGTAGFDRARVGGNLLAEANVFDGDIGWYIALDDRSCTGQDHNTASCNGTSTYPIGEGIAYDGGSNQSSQKRPFHWDVHAEGNVFAGTYMPEMTTAQYNAVLAKTWDSHNATTDPGATGTVLYGYPPEIDVTVDDGLDYVPYGGTFSYTITVSNNSSVDVNNIDVAAPFPADIEHVSPGWSCTASGGATCTASDTGDLLDSIDLPAGSHVEYSYAARAKDAAGLDEDLELLVTATTANYSRSATDHTTVVLFRDGFETTP